MDKRGRSGFSQSAIGLRLVDSLLGTEETVGVPSAFFNCTLTRPGFAQSFGCVFEG